MPSYRLLSTRRNFDGSLDTPTLHEMVTAPDAQTAIVWASRFPLQRYVERSDFAWLLDESGTVVWTSNLMPRQAA